MEMRGLVKIQYKENATLHSASAAFLSATPCLLSYQIAVRPNGAFVSVLFDLLIFEISHRQIASLWLTDLN